MKYNTFHKIFLHKMCLDFMSKQRRINQAKIYQNIRSASDIILNFSLIVLWVLLYSPFTPNDFFETGLADEMVLTPEPVVLVLSDVAGVMARVGGAAVVHHRIQ